MSDMTVTSIITWGITLLGLVAAGVFAITKYMNSNAIRALEDRMRLKDDKMREYEQKLSAAEPSAQKYLPAHEVAAELNDTHIKSLVSKIEALEKQKEQLLSEVSIRAASSLDPRSELSTLLAQLESEDEAVRAKAVNGLFTLRDPLSFLPLIKFLEKRPDEAAGGQNPYIGEWFSFFIETGGTSGLEFIAAQLESSRAGWSDMAFSKLEYKLNTTQLVDEAIPILENIALRSTSSLVRVKAKVLIQRLQVQRQEISLREQRQKEHEQKMEELGQPSSHSEDISQNLFILATLNGNELGHVAAKMLDQGQNFRYWRAGLLITQEFLIEPEHQDNCVAAIRDLIAIEERITPSSHGLLLYLLAKMELFRGNNTAAEENLQVCKEKTPVTYEYLSKNDNAFDLERIKSALLKP